MWNELPSYEDIRTILHRQADLQSRVRVAELQLDILKAEMSQKKPRDASVKVIGVDAESRTALLAAQSAYLALKEELDHVNADVTLHNFHKDVARMLAYNGRMG